MRYLTTAQNTEVTSQNYSTTWTLLDRNIGILVLDFYINRISYKSSYLRINVLINNMLYILGACVRMVGVENTVTSKKRPSVKMVSTMIIVSQFLIKLIVVPEVNYIFFDIYNHQNNLSIDTIIKIHCLQKYKGRIGLHNRFIVASTYTVDNYTTVYCRKNQRTKTHIFICLSSTIITLRSSNVPTKLQHRILTQSHGTILVIRLPSLAYKHVLYIKFMP